MPSRLTNEELRSINALTLALPPSARDSFLKMVADRVAGYSPQSRGPGLVHRIAVEAQREFLKLKDVAVGKTKPLRLRQRSS
jgi:hypothetical protein